MTTTDKTGIQEETPASLHASIFGVKRVYITYKDSIRTWKRTQPFLRKIDQILLYRKTAVYCEDHKEHVVNKSVLMMQIFYSAKGSEPR
jgi:hypothetical protein